MVSHACLRVEDVEETVEALLSLHPFNHVTETVQCPSKLDQGVDLCLKPPPAPTSWTDFNPY